MNFTWQAATGRVDAVLAGLFLWLEAFLIWPDLLFAPGGWVAHLGLLFAGHILVGDRAWGHRLKRWTAWVFCAVWVGSFLSWPAPTTLAHHATFDAAAALWLWLCWRRERKPQQATINPSTATEPGS